MKAPKIFIVPESKFSSGGEIETYSKNKTALSDDDIIYVKAGKEESDIRDLKGLLLKMKDHVPHSRQIDNKCKLCVQISLATLPTNKETQ